MNQMRAFICFLFIILMPSSQVVAKELLSPPLKHEISFWSGEKLTYQIRYGFLLGGTTTLSLKEEVYKMNPVFHAVAIAQTTGISNTIYGVKDIYESWFDKETNLPYKQVRNIKEGHYTLYNEVTYNQKNNTVHSELSGEHKVPEKILDLCSVFYYVRRIDFSKIKEGDVVFVNMYFADEVFPFHLRFLGKETIRTKTGKMSCFKISPVVEVGRMFKTQDDLTIWFTDNKECLPVLIRMDVRLVGAVIMKLIQYENATDSLAVMRRNL